MQYKKMVNEEIERFHGEDAGNTIARAILIAGAFIATAIDELADSQESMAMHLESIKEKLFEECKKGGCFNP